MGLDSLSYQIPNAPFWIPNWIQMDLCFINTAYLIDLKRRMKSKLDLNMYFDRFKKPCKLRFGCPIDVDRTQVGRPGSDLGAIGRLSPTRARSATITWRNLNLPSVKSIKSLPPMSPKTKPNHLYI